MRTRSASLALALALSGCIGAAEPCELEAGVYEWAFVEMTGDCGPVDPVVSRVAGGQWAPGDPGDCEARTDVSQDGCAVDFSMRCPDGSEAIGALHIEGPRSFGGTWQVSLPADAEWPACRSVYDVTGRRL